MEERHTIAASDAEAHFSELLGRVEGGDGVTITRSGSPIARMVPIRRRSSQPQRRAAIERIKQLAKGNRLRGLRVNDLIDEGRR